MSTFQLISNIIYYFQTFCNRERLFPPGNYMFKVKNRNTGTRCEICSELTLKTPERRQWRRSGGFIVNFEHISHLVILFIVNFEQVNADWVRVNIKFR